MRTCSRCGLLRTTQTTTVRIQGRPRPVTAEILPECVYRHAPRRLQQRACRHFFPRISGWTPEQHYEIRLGLQQNRWQNWLALSALVLAVLSLALTIALNGPAVRSFFP